MPTIFFGIVDDEGLPVPQGEIGSLQVKGDSTMAYCWNQHEKTKATLFSEWIQTGDKYYQDPDNYFWYCSRADDMLKVGGIWVSPVEVENTLVNLVVDGVVYARQHVGGINTFHGAVLPRLATRHDVTVYLLVPRQCMGVPPGPPVRTVCRDWIPPRTRVSWRLDERLQPHLERLSAGARHLWIRSKRDAVFVSTYLTDAPARTPAVAVALDMNHELFPHLYTDAFGTWLRQRYPVYLRSATRIVAISATTKAHVVEFYGVPADQIDVVHLATDPERFYPAAPGTEPERYIFYVGGRRSYKNFRLVLEAAARGFARLGLSLVVAGPPWSPLEQAEIDRLGLHGRVRLEVNPSDETLRALYARSFAFVFPSLHEGFGLPLLEAMACGTPVLAADTPIFREVAGPAPLYFDPHDADALLDAAGRLARPTTRAEHVRTGLAHAGLYSWDATAAALHATCSRALRV